MSRQTSVLVGLVLLVLVSAAQAAPRFRARGEGVIQRSAARLALGLRHTCMLLENGTVSCWGSNGSGQLGDGTTEERRTPVTVPGLAGVIAIAAGTSSTCALINIGTVSCWGKSVADFNEELLVPTPVQGLGNAAVAIAAGDSTVCAVLINGTVSCWGFVVTAEGPGSVSGFLQATPTPVTGISRAIGIAAGRFHMCVLNAGGGVQCWGSNQKGQLGDGTTTLRTTPVAVQGLTHAVSIAAADDTSCTIVDAGNYGCWGDVSSGQLPPETSSFDSRVPIYVGRKIAQITVGSTYLCMLTIEATAECTGEGQSGQLGHTSTSDPTVPGLANALTINASFGGFHTCALVADGTVRCWGSNLTGQLGDGGSDSGGANLRIVFGIAGSIGAMTISAGADHTCAVRGNGTVSCWGRNGSGQLGDGTLTNRRTPTPINNLANVIATVAGDFHTCALVADGTVQCWGSNGFGQLGIGTVGGLRSVPAAVPGLSGVASIAAGRNHTCALTFDAVVQCWGGNDEGQIGDGTRTDRLNPITIPMTNASYPAIAIAAGREHTCALLAGGFVECWGNNSDGRLGDGTTTDRLVPTFVPTTLNGAVDLVAAPSHTCVLLFSGSVRCWGFNLGGQLGDSTTTTRTSPTAVSLITSAVALTANGAHTCVLLATGAARCWGSNQNGELGDGTRTDRTSRVAVGSFTGGVTIAAGNDHTCATLSNGVVRCWGLNFFGQIGDGTATDRLTPVTVPSFQ